MFDLSGKVALVTGGGQGVGEGILRTLSRQGASVAVNDYYPERAEAVASDISASGGNAMSVPFDVADMEAVQAAVDRVHAQWGRLDILVNNAGVVPTGMQPTPFTRTTPEGWRPIVDINLYGTLNCTHCVLPGMIEQGWGRVISISSDAARVGHFGSSVYSAVKAGGEALMRTLAKELGSKGITANSIVLGLINTVPPEFSKGTEKYYSTGRIGTPEDVAAAALYLCSEEAAWVSGESLVVNGGFLGA
jgi:2-hydroxycyclohexanecarboxyl-CoA dehydrogenase